MLRLVAATANPNKLAEIEAILAGRVVLAPRPAAVPDVIEDADTLEGNARLKARAIAVATGQAAVADDTGLEVDALGGAPGVRSARFAGPDADDAANVARVLNALESCGARTPSARRARFRTVALVHHPDGRETVAEGVVEGAIASAPRGSGGFGYDVVFVPDDGDGRTFAEMTAAEKHAISHRGRAFRALGERLAAPASRPLVVVGAGGHAREVLDIVDACNAAALADGGVAPWSCVGVVADGHADLDLLDRRGVALLGPVASASAVVGERGSFVVGIGDGAVRRRLDEQLTAAGLRAAVLVHPSVTTGADVELAPGVVVAAGARLTTNVRLARHVHVNVGAVVSHDVRVGPYATLSPGVLLNGATVVGEAAFLGAGAIVTPGRRIGADAVIGAGAVVVRDVPAGVTAKGVPATW